MSKISVIGAGSVGATVANDLMIQGVASEIVLVDINKKKAFGEALDIYYDAKWPSGARQTDMLGNGWKSGSKGSARFSYPVPIFAQEGTLSFRIYDKNTQEELGSDSITFNQ